ncbi:XRE family transcriptional regulator [Pararhodospirillum photometricum]|nr:XRE family transcriptional regulator [Pararhodospirillum photometricum]
MNDIGKRIADSRKDQGLSQYALAKLLGVNQSTIAYYERGRNTPKPWIVEDIARLLNVSASYLLYGRDAEDPPVPVVGTVGAGGVITYPSELPLDLTQPPPGASSRTQAVRVEGDGLWPVYRAGDLLFHAAVDPHRMPEDLYGRDCIVRTSDGQTLVRHVKRGRTKALFTLAAFNAPDEEDVALDTAAPIRWIRRA